jgi:hypothetical protein
MTDERVLRCLRAQAWSRAKGELEAMLDTFYADTSSEGNFRRLDDAKNEFVRFVEDEGLHE